MPDKPLTVLTYAASASLAAVALVYFFNPNQLIEGDSFTSSANRRKKGIVGLVNPANDCFINSVLQSLVGLGDLRLFLIREVYRRELGNATIYTAVPEKDAQGKNVNSAKLVSLQCGEVTQGLNSILDQLNERPTSKKSISAQSFIGVLEHAFGLRISRAQQDAQELLQIVAERLSEEYHAAKQARQRHKERLRREAGENVRSPPQSDESKPEAQTLDPSAVASQLLTPIAAADEIMVEAEEGFPLEGQTEARVECQHCHFVPKPTPTNFVMLNLMVPQKGTTTLNECFDAHFKTEYIDDYKCDRCRLDHAIETLEEETMFAKSNEQKEIIQSKIKRVRTALDVDPEKPPDRVQLPGIQYAPKRKVARHVQIIKFPKILVIHLSRSMFDPGTSSQKNWAKLSFPEKLPIGGILHRRTYKLLGMVTHRGTHNSGHYETFRRQHLHPSTSRQHVKHSSRIPSASATPNLAQQPSPRTSENFAPNSNSRGESSNPIERSSFSANESPAASTNSSSLPSTRPSSSTAAVGTESQPLQGTERASPTHAPDQSTSILSPPIDPKPSPPAFARYSASLDLTRFRRKRKSSDRWWRISDEKIKECSTVDVLDMQKDVYMLFYEMEKDEMTTS
ncbi:MAG: hypothetical protein LQ343_006878 [Gyalolechia ehrenbergii]|nr:MAG: hypothetical protein LQ343_006878 [Gyalolechia ehrenbergii]